MKLLAVDTCLGACSVAIVVRDGTAGATPAVLAGLCERRDTGHAERLFPMIDEVLSRAGCTVADCDGIAVTLGPGTFTGVRLGVAAARGLALAAGLPVWTATSLALVAAAARARAPLGTGRILAVADARNTQVHAQLFAADGTADGAPQLLTLAAAAAMVDADVTLAGSGAAAVARAAGEAGRTTAAVHTDIEPDARFLATVPLIAADRPLPLYARPPDAKPQIGKSLPRVAT